MSHSLSVRSQGQEPNGRYTWLRMTVSLSKLDQMLFTRNCSHYFVALSDNDETWNVSLTYQVHR